MGRVATLRRAERCLESQPSISCGGRGRKLQPNTPASSNGAASKCVGGTADTSASGSVENAGVDHRGLQVPVTQELLDRPDIVSLLEYRKPPSRRCSRLP